MDAGRMGVLPACPSCGSTSLLAVSDGEDTNFLCGACGSCWHVELGWVRRVDPDQCPGCPDHALCEAAASGSRSVARG